MPSNKLRWLMCRYCGRYLLAYGYTGPEHSGVKRNRGPAHDEPFCPGREWFPMKRKPRGSLFAKTVNANNEGKENV